jgi:predicted Fe-Mo cluster-binding NifX family protein
MLKIIRCTTVAPLFGRAKWFAIVDKGKINIIPNNQSGGRAVVDLLYEMNIDALLIQEMGIVPYERVKEYGDMAIYHTGFKRILLNDLLKKFENDELELLDDTNIENIIKQHNYRNRNH